VLFVFILKSVVIIIQTIFLNANSLHVGIIRVHGVTTTTPISVISHRYCAEQQQLVINVEPKLLSGAQYTLHIQYSANLTADMVGMYLSTVRKPNGDVSYV
jgi:hypothetical protein